MTKTRQVDEFGNISYTVRNADGEIIGQIFKTCSAWQAELPGDGGYAPVRSVKGGMEWFAFIADLRDRPAISI